MIILMVVPFLIGMILSRYARTVDVHFEYIFQVQVNSKFQEFSSNDFEMTSLLVELKCQGLLNGMMCRIGRYKLLEPLPAEFSSSRQSIYADRFIDPHAFDNKGKPFLINFSSEGIKSYVVEQNSIPTRMMNVYRMIADQLNIGTEIKREHDDFEVMEQSYMGLCLTKYSIVRQEPTLDTFINLVSLIDLKWGNNDKILIIKRRKVDQCQLPSNYTFSARFWPEFVAKTTASLHLKWSTSTLEMEKHGVNCSTANIFELHDKHMSKIGSIEENIKVLLYSYRRLPPHEIITFDNSSIVSLDAINDGDA